MMESNVPFDTSSPAVRDYLSLVRLQVLTPLSLLINIVCLVICSVVISPSLEEVSNDFRTVLSPKSWMIQMYIIAVWVGQIGYCGLLVLARKPETKVRVYMRNKLLKILMCVTANSHPWIRTMARVDQLGLGRLGGCFRELIHVYIRIKTNN
jgi:hypothetical protein